MSEDIIGDTITAIVEGKMDQGLKGIQAAVTTRTRFLQKVKGIQNQAEFVPGTRVYISGNITPKYLLNICGTVSNKPAERSGDLMVNLDYKPQGRYPQHLGVPASCLTKLNPVE